MTYLFTDADFTAAEMAFLSLTAQAAASSDSGQKASLTYAANQQVAAILGSVPGSKASAASVLRVIANPAVSEPTNDVVGGLMRCVTYLTTPFA